MASLLPPFTTAMIPIYQPAAGGDMDTETAELIARLVLEDLEEVIAELKGKSRADAPLSDQEVAYKLQQESFQDWLVLSQDEKYARSLSNALSTDSAYLDALIVAETAAAHDRRSAELLSRGEALPPPTPSQIQIENPTFVMHPDIDRPNSSSASTPRQTARSLGKSRDDSITPRALSPLNFKANVYHADNEEEADWDFNVSALSAHHSWKSKSKFDDLAPGPSVDHNKSIQCTICNDPTPYRKALHTPCDHNYCGDCVVDLVKSFVRDESLFPLRCCNEPIPIADFDTFISATLRTLFLEKQAEFSILSKDRLYCCEPACSTFLGSTVGVKETGVACPACAKLTCPECKQAEHTGEDCEANAATIAVQALGREQGWQICPQCHNLVELSIGCYHMTCRCRAQFCYLCAVPWKHCSCPQWEEARLLETARQRVENELGARAVRTMAPEIIVQEVHRHAQVLRDNHDCDGHVWRYRNGGGQCEECHHYLDRFLKICKNCSLLACQRCTLNRL